MWMRLSNGREELVLNPHHIERFLREGGVEIPDPQTAATSQEETVQEQAKMPDLEEIVQEQEKVQALEAEIARLKEQVALLEAQNQEQTDGTNEHGGAHSKSASDGGRRKRSQPTV